jgi:hypothetical protein
MRVLLVIDVQKQFVDNNVEKVIRYCEDNRGSYDVILPTMFRNDKNKNFKDKLNWYDCSNISYDDILVKPKNTEIEVKSGYSSKKIFEVCSCKDKVDVVGCDSDACILATAFNLWDKEYDFRILSDYVYTTGKIDNRTIIKVLKRNFGKCVV